MLQLHLRSTILLPTQVRLLLKTWRYTVVTHHYNDVIMGAMASQITSLTIVYSTVYSDQPKYQRSASLAFVRGIHRWRVNSPHKWPVTRKMFPFDDVIMNMLVYILWKINVKPCSQCHGNGILVMVLCRILFLFRVIECIYVPLCYNEMWSFTLHCDSPEPFEEFHLVRAHFVDLSC